MSKRTDSPLAVLVHVRVRLHRVLLDQELDALVERGRDRGRLLAQQHLHRIVAGQAHDVLGADRIRAALGVRAIGHAICMEGRIRTKLNAVVGRSLSGKFSARPSDTRTI